MKNGWYITMYNATNLKHSTNSHIVNFYYKDGEWFEHSSCYEDSRCTGFVNNCCRVIGGFENDNAALIKNEFRMLTFDEIVIQNHKLKDRVVILQNKVDKLEAENAFLDQESKDIINNTSKKLDDLRDEITKLRQFKRKWNALNPEKKTPKQTKDKNYKGLCQTLKEFRAKQRSQNTDQKNPQKPDQNT